MYHLSKSYCKVLTGDEMILFHWAGGGGGGKAGGWFTSGGAASDKDEELAAADFVWRW